MTHAILEIRHATVYRGDTCVFDDLSLEIAHGEQTAILGPNGAGKSTLLKLLARELYWVPQEGSAVRLFGQERWDVWALRKRLGLVSHDLQHEYANDATGIEVILSGLYASIGVWRRHPFTADELARAARLMTQLGVAGLGERRFGTLSTGEQRRFLLGRALIHDPEALVLDEPTSGLDMKACFQYLEVIRGLMRAGKTVILATHHIHEIPPEIERVVLLKAGKVVADGKKADVLTAANLGRLFDTPIRLVQANGFYQALPGETASR
ncbi:ABC transporter ATP-binding protein [Nitrospira sp. Kam-Ns4a]